MKQLKASEFKAKCLAILDDLPPEGIEVTKHGKPVARVMPVSEDVLRFAGSVPGLVLSGDILSTGSRWDAES
ncbi:MAG: type II toxin-antitoxin system Phd/YefM family antitoxin [Nitrospirae bacterium]|nr:type II toxin-antitoxin system Phd/YefM family antitoxin [Fimbriimonadaceae bacterium]